MVEVLSDLKQLFPSHLSALNNPMQWNQSGVTFVHWCVTEFAQYIFVHISRRGTHVFQTTVHEQMLQSLFAVRVLQTTATSTNITRLCTWSCTVVTSFDSTSPEGSAVKIHSLPAALSTCTQYDACSSNCWKQLLSLRNTNCWKRPPYRKEIQFTSTGVPECGIRR